MPIFEFQCSRCGNIFEELVLSGDDEDIKCPKCRDKKVNRLISRTGSIRKNNSVAQGPPASSCGGGAFT